MSPASEGEVRAEPRGRRLARGLARVWIAVGVTLALLLLGEVAARLVLAVRPPAVDRRLAADSYPRQPWVAELYRENARSARMGWQPYVYWRRLPFAGRLIGIDARGLRRTWRQPAAPAGAPGGAPLRIFVFGGSTIWGTGVRDDHTIPSELARDLAAAGVAAEVTNFGESGYVSTQSAITLLRELQRGDVPDVVVFYVGFTDFLSAMDDGAGVPLNEDHRRREFNLLQSGRRMARTALAVLVSRSSLLRLSGLAAPRPAARPAPAPAAAARIVDDGFRALDANVRAVSGLAAAYGFQVSFFVEPSILEKRRLTPYEARSAATIAARGVLLGAEALLAREWAARDPDELTDLGGLFADTSGPRFLDAGHLSEEANREVAAAICRQLREHGRLRRRGAAAGPLPTSVAEPQKP